MISCREVTELVTDYAEGRLGRWDRLRFQLHLGLCTHCREFVRQVRIARSAMPALPPPPLPGDVEEELLRRFRGWKGQP